MTDHGNKKWTIFLLVASGVFMSTLDSSIVNIALPFIMEDLNARFETIQWVIVIYLLLVSSLLLTFGRLSDIKGRRIIYCSGFMIFSAGSLFCSLASEASFLIFSRAVQGCGASMLMACSPALVVDIFPLSERGKALGMVGTVVAAGLTAGPIIGGVLLDLFSWRFIFFINIPIGVVSAFLGAYILKGTNADKGNSEPLDKKGGILLVVSLFCLILAITHFDQWGAFSMKIIALFVLFFVTCTGFIITELKAEFPLFEPALLRVRLFVFPIISAGILFAALFIIIFMMPFYLIDPCGFSASATGGIMVTPFLVLFFVSPVSGILCDRTGTSRGLCTFGMILLSGSLLSFTMIEPSAPVSSILWRLALAGTGTAFFISPNSSAAMGSIPAHRRGIASAAVATARNLGMVMGVALAGLIFSVTFSNLTDGASLKDYTPDMESAFMAGFHNAMLAGVIIAFAGVLIAFMRGGIENKKI
ncbi:MAG: MFS transporter [Thermodesulfobacteriota bacterium]|nr:MFS transporter [Thermodesulfobacteriota bacterium]